MSHPLLLIGYWKNLTDSRKLWFPRGFVDPAWHPADFAKIIQYLKSGIGLASYLGHSFCRFPDGPPDSEMGSRELTDGVWAWPEGFAVYVEQFSVRLPEEFVAHMRRHRFIAPANPDMAELESRSLDLSFWISWCKRNYKRPSLTLFIKDWMHLIRKGYS